VLLFLPLLDRWTMTMMVLMLVGPSLLEGRSWRERDVHNNNDDAWLARRRRDEERWRWIARVLWWIRCHGDE